MAKYIQAIRLHDYGTPEDLKLEQIECPQPGENEVLVRVLAAGVNPVDWKVIGGAMRQVFPLHFPYIPGRDFAGIVEEVGPGVVTFEKGQAVFGQGTKGAYAEYVVAPRQTLALKPEEMSFDEAATIPVGAAAAWQGLFDHGHLQPGQRVLIQGAAGGVGTLAVQLAHWKGAYVIGTASTSNVDYVRSLGADEVIDYQTTAVEQAVHDVDLVFDTVGAPTINASLGAVMQGGILISIGGRPGETKVKEKQVHYESLFAQVSHDQLDTFAQLIKEGRLKASIEATYPLAETAQAFKRSQSGHGRGRVVLRIAGEEQ